MDAKKIGCLVMAAGNGARFGKNKLLAELAGKSLIRRTLEAVPAGLFEAVTVVTQYDEVAALAAEFGFAAVRNHHPEAGLSHTIRLGTQAMADCDGILYLVADQPFLTGETVKKLVACWKADSSRIVGAAHGGRRGNPNLFPASLFGELMALEGDRGGSGVIRRYPELLTLVEAPEAELLDCDTSADLEKWTT